ANLHVLPDRDEWRNRRVLRSEGLRNHRTDVGHRNRLRRNVAGMPMVLMPRVEDEAEIGSLEAADDRSSIDYACDALEALRDLDVIDRGVNARKGAQNPFGSDTGLERRVSLRIERFGLCHAAGQP